MTWRQGSRVGVPRLRTLCFLAVHVCSFVRTGCEPWECDWVEFSLRKEKDNYLIRYARQLGKREPIWGKNGDEKLDHLTCLQLRKLPLSFPQCPQTVCLYEAILVIPNLNMSHIHPFHQV